MNRNKAIEHLKHESDIKHAILALDALSETDRTKVFSFFCVFCGAEKIPGKRCTCSWSWQCTCSLSSDPMR